MTQDATARAPVHDPVTRASHRPCPPGTRPMVVARNDRVAEDIVAIELLPADGRALAPFDAGAHVDLHLPNGLVRPYSLCNAPRERHRYLLGVLREPASRGGSACAHDALPPGSVLPVGAPRNAFALRPVPHAVLLAGGIGVTPLLAMAEALHDAGASFELHLAARRAARVPFADRLRDPRWAGRVHVHLDDGPPGARFDAAACLRAAPAGSEAWVCGPAGFVTHVRAMAQAQGWADDRLHVEHFQPPPAADGEAAFELVWAPTGQRVTVPSGRSAAQALAAAGIEVALCCEQGVCGTCLLRVLDGVPQHRDQWLSADERAAGGLFTPCCSRAVTPRLVVAPLD